ncbi:hypothetical protein BDV98DRAFT_573498 [Pterulicium gracile]|uniref:Uncharacterized protein n=1 Tax=Pterulicium gracile TaxID=1884261 RepID=A0A5C3QD71_9AGAR|nr:hypothetical protein BDV98DRAFT_573498 [Pterula gracilis]
MRASYRIFSRIRVQHHILQSTRPPPPRLIRSSDLEMQVRCSVHQNGLKRGSQDT